MDLAWGEGSETRPANRSGVVALEPDGRISSAGWTIGLEEAVEWIEANAVANTLLFVDAPLVIDNAEGQRLAERQVGQRYGRWWVSANSTNMKSPRQAGVQLRQRLEGRGWRYDDGLDGPPTGGRVLSECYPYTTIVGASEFGYDDKRPPYKRAPKGMKATEAWPRRTSACDELIRRLSSLAHSDVPIYLASHCDTAQLADVPSPAGAAQYKKREDLLDAAICAWTAALWHRFGEERCQVLGVEADQAPLRPIASIIAPARSEQRRLRGGFDR
jgi:predicted RNase H-like nuclease